MGLKQSLRSPAEGDLLRCAAIRVLNRQGKLFAADASRYFEVATNSWNREKSGTIQALHSVVTAVKRLVLPREMVRARPKRLRFLVLALPRKLVQHARRFKLRLTLAWRSSAK